MIKVKLRTYQRGDVRKIISLKGRVILGLEMGLGKTLEVLTYLNQEKDTLPALVICPASLKLHWEREAKTFYKMRSSVIFGEVPYGLQKRPLTIINFEILESWLPLLLKRRFKTVIIDECHYISNLSTERYKNTRILARRAEKLLFLSGTPITNKPWDIFAALHLLHPKRFSSPWTFGMKFCEAEKSFGKWRFRGARNLNTLHELLKKYGLIRRTKREVLKDLPPKNRIVLPLSLSDPKEYNRAENDFLGWVTKNMGLERASSVQRAEFYAKFTYLKRLAAQLKLPMFLDWLDNFLEETDEKILVGFHHRDIGKKLITRYGKQATIIYGGMTALQRQQSEDRFRKDSKVRIMAGQLQAAGVGLNLPEATSVGVFEFPWKPGDLQQFIDRAHRFTSKMRVNIYFFVGSGTIDEKICRIIQRKQRILDKVLDGVPVREDSLTLYSELQKVYLKGAKKR